MSFTTTHCSSTSVAQSSSTLTLTSIVTSSNLQWLLSLKVSRHFSTINLARAYYSISPFTETINKIPLGIHTASTTLSVSGTSRCWLPINLPLCRKFLNKCRKFFRTQTQPPKFHKLSSSDRRQPSESYHWSTSSKSKRGYLSFVRSICSRSGSEQSQGCFCRMSFTRIWSSMKR
jgi:hypothetical protein